ncbi:hypothetical protein [Actinoallomurus sp. NPDC050550]|uniref:hypothetical protein n=1 Tax=Actinoallomurus sp. NPDC050550 TaxID=3154937 RepID=UPI003406CD5F
MSGGPKADAPAQAPYLLGFDVEWRNDQWIATSRSAGRFVIRGKDAAELLRKRDAIYRKELRGLQHLLDTLPVVGQPPRGLFREQTLRQLIELDPETARHFLAELGKST